MIHRVPLSRCWIPVLVAATVAASGACEPPDEASASVDVQLAPTPPLVGPNRMVVEVGDSVGAPVDGARVEVKGGRSGRAAVVEEAEPAGGGRYVIEEFEFDSGGEWELTTRIRLPDGRGIERDRTVSVVGTQSDGGGR